MATIFERILGLTETAPDTFSVAPVMPDQRGVYGGQVLAQCLWAMSRTVGDERVPHSLHGYFTRPARDDVETVFTVVRERDGRGFSNRRVTASQAGKDIFLALGSFHLAPPVDSMPTFQQQVLDPAIPLPHDLESSGAVDSRLLIEVRTVPRGEGAVATRQWARSPEPLPSSQAAHASMLAYFADLHTGLFATPPGGFDTVSVDHAMWFHRPIDMEDWVLTDLEPLVVASGRGTYRGTVYDTAGTVVASFVQEMLYTS